MVSCERGGKIHSVILHLVLLMLQLPLRDPFRYSLIHIADRALSVCVPRSLSPWCLTVQSCCQDVSPTLFNGTFRLVDVSYCNTLHVFPLIWRLSTGEHVFYLEQF